MFIVLFEENANVVAVGPYLSCEFDKHIQSFMLVLDKRSIPILEKTWRCPYENEGKMAWIQETEVVFTLVDAVIHSM